MERSIEFYTKIIGLKLLSRRLIAKNDAEIAFLQDQEKRGAVLELTFYKGQKEFNQPEYQNRLFDHLAFEINNMEYAIKTMKHQGVTITDEPFKLSPDGLLIAFIEDPDGTLIELIEPK
jgi:lactoylglutathione lyase